MTIVEITSEHEAAAVYAKLQALGEAWRPVEDMPCLVYLEDGSAEEVRRIGGVASCWEGRSGRIARLLHMASRRSSACQPGA